MGVDQLCVIVVQKRSAKDYRLRAKIFDVETGGLKQTASYPNYMKNDFDLYDLSNSAALEFASMCIISRMNILADSYQTELDADIEKLKSVRKNVNLKALTLSLVPGLGLMQKGHKGEGACYLIGEGVVVGGAILCHNLRVASAKEINRTHNAE